MKISMLTWEYPPRIVGGIARHCHDLAKALAALKHEVHIFTLDFPGAPAFEETEDGIKIYRVTCELGHPHFLTWVLLFNHFMEKRMAEVSQKTEFDVLHVHDWLTAPVGIAFKYSIGKPLLLTIHSTEHGRSGIHNPDSSTIDGVEWWSTYEANKVITTSGSMKSEICDHFKLPWEKVDIIPNAIDPSKYRGSVDRGAVRARYGVRSHEKLVLAVGRLVPQKGIEYLIQAVPSVARRFPEAKFIIVGEGWYRDHLQYQAGTTGQAGRIKFTGFIPDHELIALTKSADVLVVPSIYEPFGIVALEGMAAGAPVVASKVGGLAEIIEHDKTGVLVYPGNPDSIAWGINHVLSNPDHARWLAQNAKRTVPKAFSWKAIAKKTVKLYSEVAR
ncbi:MAG: glycosyltransferase family 4 protein [Candidatus Bathyarchaeota archaeon]|jgi:glycosyltransferase involved in cell wall biosynthesis